MTKQKPLCPCCRQVFVQANYDCYRISVLGTTASERESLEAFEVETEIETETSNLEMGEVNGIHEAAPSEVATADTSLVSTAETVEDVSSGTISTLPESGDEVNLRGLGASEGWRRRDLQDDEFSVEATGEV